MQAQQTRWYEKSYRRNLIDMHIPDWNPVFLSQFDPDAYVNNLVTAGVDTAMLYAGSCLGICYWPTQAGHMHTGLNGRDTLGEMIDGCHRQGMNVVVYLNYWSKWAYDEHPDWRVINAVGKGTAEYMWTPGRYGVCCINSPYRDFVLAQVRDLCTHYDFEALWIDMIFWPTVCYCGHCRKRYHDEVGGDIPKVVNWEDPHWVHFQRKREAWLVELVSEITHTARQIKPDISVAHQSASWAMGWEAGLTQEFFLATDYMSGDFYGDPLHQSFTCKLGYSLTQNKPFEFMTSRCPTLHEHTVTKSKAMLMAQVYSALANNSSFQFIDAIDPIGTLNPTVYELMGEIFQETRQYEPFINANAPFLQDVAIYLNLESLINLEDNGKNVADVSRTRPILKSAMNVARALINHNIPFGVITDKNLAELANHQILVLPNLLVIDNAEVAAFTDFVARGGSLYASKRTSLLTKNGEKQPDFLLSHLFGVSYLGETAEDVTYMAPTDAVTDVFQGLSHRFPTSIYGTQLLVEAAPGSDVLATVTLPYTNPHDVTRCGSAISNPPGLPTGYPSLVYNRYGEGQVIYAAGELEASEDDVQRAIFVGLLRRLQSRPFWFEANAPKSVELTLFEQPDKRRLFLNFLNFQSELPNLPVHGLEVSVHLGARQVNRILLLPHEQALDMKTSDGTVSFTLPRLETFAMVALEY